MHSSTDFCRILAEIDTASPAGLRSCLHDALNGVETPFFNLTAASLVPLLAAVLATIGVVAVLIQRYQADWATNSWKRIEWAIDQIHTDDEGAVELGFLAITKVLDDDKKRSRFLKWVGIRLSDADIELLQAAAEQADLSK